MKTKIHSIFLLFVFAPIFLLSQNLKKEADITKVKTLKKLDNSEWIPKITLPVQGTVINVNQPISVRGTGIPGATICVHPLWIWDSKTRRSAANSRFGSGMFYTRVKSDGTWEVYPAFNTKKPHADFGPVQYLGFEVTQIDDTYKIKAQTILPKYKIRR